MRFFPLLLLSCLTCVGQPGPIALRSIDRWAVKSDFPSTIGGMWIRLRATDLPPNSVQNWTSEVGNITYSQNTGGLQPTNNAATKGVWFTLGNYMTAGAMPMPYHPTQQVFIVYQSHGGTGFRSVLAFSGSECSIGDLTGAGGGFGSYTVGTQRLWCTPIPADDVYHDVICVGGGYPVQAYTNGVAGNTIASGSISFTIDRLGANQVGISDKFQGYIAEIIMWTNPVVFDATTVSNLHYYATNTYGYAP